MDLGALVRAARDGDGESWNALVERYSGLIWSVARAHRLGDAVLVRVLEVVRDVEIGRAVAVQVHELRRQPERLRLGA